LKTSKSILIYVLSTWIISALVWLIGSYFNSSILIIVGISVPSVLALIMTFRKDKQTFYGLLKSLFNFKISLKSYLLIFMYLPMIVVISYIIMRLLNIETPDVSYKIYEVPLVFVVILFTMGPLGEEIGWRGYVLPTLTEKHHILKASLILGLIWSVWHLPLFFMSHSLQYAFVQSYGFFVAFAGYLTYTMLLSIFMGIMYEKTHHHLCAQILIHTIANLTIGIMPIVFNIKGALIQLIIMTLFTLILIYFQKIGSHATVIQHNHVDINE